jgi:hypothetical protein
MPELTQLRHVSRTLSAGENITTTLDKATRRAKLRETGSFFELSQGLRRAALGVAIDRTHRELKSPKAPARYRVPAVHLSITVLLFITIIL